MQDPLSLAGSSYAYGMPFVVLADEHSSLLKALPQGLWHCGQQAVTGSGEFLGRGIGSLGILTGPKAGPSG